MTVRDLNREQLNELKETYATQLAECGEDKEVLGISYQALADVTEIPDEVIFNHYEGMTFTEDDFFCSVGKDEETTRISGIIFEHGNDDFGLWEGFNLSEEDENAIWNILSKYDTEGCSVRGTRKEIAEEIGG